MYDIIYKELILVLCELGWQNRIAGDHAPNILYVESSDICKVTIRVGKRLWSIPVDVHRKPRRITLGKSLPLTHRELIPERS